MVEALGGFDPQATYDEASRAYEDASRDYWQYLSRRTVDRLRLRPGEHVLDVPCGTGPSLVPAAEQVGPTGRVVGIDYAAQMLAIAQEKVQARGLAHVELRLGDMTAIPAPERPFDAVVCVLGIFFVDDMPGLARSLYGLVRPDGGRLGVGVFGERFFEPMREVFLDAVATVAPGVHVVQPWCRVETAAVLERIFEDAGIADVVVEEYEDTLPLPSADDWWRIVMGSGFRRTIGLLDAEQVAEVRGRCAAAIARQEIGQVVSRTRTALAVRA